MTELPNPFGEEYNPNRLTMRIEGTFEGLQRLQKKLMESLARGEKGIGLSEEYTVTGLRLRTLPGDFVADISRVTQYDVILERLNSPLNPENQNPGK